MEGEHKEKVYKCAKCGYEFTKEEMEELESGIICPRCGWRIIIKLRPAYQIKSVKAS